MVWIISMILAVLVCAGVFIYGKTLRGEDNDRADRSLGGWLLIGAPILFLVWAGGHTGFNSVHQVPAGHVAVVYQFGAITGQMPEGLQIIPPWQDVKIANIQVQKHQFEALTAFSEETQDVFIVATLNYEVSPEAIQKLYRTVGPNYFEKLVEARVNQNFKDETVKYKSVDIAPNREIIRKAVRDRLARELRPFSINVVDLLIDDIDFKEEFKQAIEDKQIATQDALREQRKIEQKKAEAQQVIEKARGDAEAVLINATAQAEANRLLGESLSDEVIRFQMIQKLAGNIDIAIVDSIDSIILDTDSLFEDKEE